MSSGGSGTSTAAPLLPATVRTPVCVYICMPTLEQGIGIRCKSGPNVSADVQVTVETVSPALADDSRRREEDGEEGSSASNVGWGGLAESFTAEVHAPHGVCAGTVLTARVVPLEGFSSKEPLIVHCYGTATELGQALQSFCLGWGEGREKERLS